jgi:hypothetical protein
VMGSMSLGTMVAELAALRAVSGVSVLRTLAGLGWQAFS